MRLLAGVIVQFLLTAGILVYLIWYAVIGFILLAIGSGIVVTLADLLKGA